IVSGAADRSYGIQVAKLAGLPAAVVARAKTLLAEFEAAGRVASIDKQLADLPLFSAPSTPFSAPSQQNLIEQAIDAIDRAEPSPRGAIDALYRLKQLRAKNR